MKWHILKDSAVGAGDYKDTGEIFDDGCPDWDHFDNSILQNHLADLGPEYGATLDSDPDPAPADPAPAQS